jgi:hypothetical protein
MVNLLHPDLRLRDLRKLVEDHLNKVTWERGVNETSEWIIASTNKKQNQKHRQNLISWLCSKNIKTSAKAICVDTGWSELKPMQWGAICNNPERIFHQKDVLVIASDRSWIIEYASRQEIFRFGRFSTDS